MINADDYLISWREGEVSFIYCIMTACAAHGSKDKKKIFVCLASARNKENVQYGC